MVEVVQRRETGFGGVGGKVDRLDGTGTGLPGAQQRLPGRVIGGAPCRYNQVVSVSIAGSLGPSIELGAARSAAGREEQWRS